jgi:hypothetical protein
MAHLPIITTLVTRSVRLEASPFAPLATPYWPTITAFDFRYEVPVKTCLPVEQSARQRSRPGWTHVPADLGYEHRFNTVPATHAQQPLSGAVRSGMIRNQAGRFNHRGFGKFSRSPWPTCS